MSNRVVPIMVSYAKSSVLGALSLCFVNFCAGFSGVSLGFGWLSVGMSVVFGAPGVLGLLLLNAMFSV